MGEGHLVLEDSLEKVQSLIGCLMASSIGRERVLNFVDSIDS